MLFLRAAAQSNLMPGTCWERDLRCVLLFLHAPWCDVNSCACSPTALLSRIWADILTWWLLSYAPALILSFHIYIMELLNNRVIFWEDGTREGLLLLSPLPAPSWEVCPTFCASFSFPSITDIPRPALMVPMVTYHRLTHFYIPEPLFESVSPHYITHTMIAGSCQRTSRNTCSPLVSYGNEYHMGMISGT